MILYVQRFGSDTVVTDLEDQEVIQEEIVITIH